MIIKNHLAKIALFGLIGVAFLIQPAQAYESGLGFGFGLPAMKVASSDGAAFVISSVPVIIKHEVSKNIFTANIPNDKGGYSTVIIQKLGNQFRELPVELYPEVPQLKMMYVQ
jgi:hypothetical protein